MSALSDAIVAALQELLRVLFSPIRGLIEQHAGDLLRIVVGTPNPDAVFTRPTNGAWPGLYDYYWGRIVPIALLLWGLAIGLVIVLESTSVLFSNYHRSKLKKRAFTGLVGILMWWWIGAYSLRLMDALTGALLPNLGEVTLFQTLSFSGIGVIGVVISLSVDFGLFVLIAVIYLVRELSLYLLVSHMPILIAFWIPGVGPFALVSQFVKRLATFYVPFLFMTVPIVGLLRVSQFLGESAGLSIGGIGAWLTAMVVPVVAVLAPIVLVRQIGWLFIVGGRMSRHVSTRRARSRGERAHTIGQASGHRGRNFVRGVRGQSAVREDGTAAFGAGDSRTNRVGRQLRRTVSERSTTLRSRLSAPRDDSSDETVETQRSQPSADTATPSETHSVETGPERVERASSGESNVTTPDSDHSTVSTGDASNDDRSDDRFL